MYKIHMNNIGVELADEERVIEYAGNVLDMNDDDGSDWSFNIRKIDFDNALRVIAGYGESVEAFKQPELYWNDNDSSLSPCVVSKYPEIDLYHGPEGAEEIISHYEADCVCTITMSDGRTIEACPSELITLDQFIEQGGKLERTFKVEDGFVLSLLPDQNGTLRWTDGDLEFDDSLGVPMDRFGEPLPGDYMVGTKQTIWKAGKKEVVNNANDFILSAYGLYYAYEYDETHRCLGVFDSRDMAVERIREANAGICLRNGDDIVFYEDNTLLLTFAQIRKTQPDWDGETDGSVMEIILDPLHPDWVRISSEIDGVLFLKKEALLSSLKLVDPLKAKAQWQEYLEEGNGVILEGMCKLVTEVVGRVNPNVKWENLYVRSIDWMLENVSWS